jgi:hypothetical protein
MLAVPILSMLIFMIAVAGLGIKLNKRFISLGVLFFISSSSSVMRWMTSNTTDSLLVAIFAIVGYVIAVKVSNFYWFPLVGFLILLSGITRISIVFWTLIATILFMQNFRIKSTYVLLISIGILIPTLLTHETSSFLAVEGDRPFLDKLILYPFYLIKITLYEFVQLFVMDRILFLILVICILISIKNFHRESSKYALLVLLAGLITGAINGNVGVNFRYQLPVLFFICWALIDNLNLPLNFTRKMRAYLKL